MRSLVLPRLAMSVLSSRYCAGVMVLEPRGIGVESSLPDEHGANTTITSSTMFFT